MQPKEESQIPRKVKEMPEALTAHDSIINVRKPGQGTIPKAHSNPINNNKTHLAQPEKKTSSRKNNKTREPKSGKKSHENALKESASILDKKNSRVRKPVQSSRKKNAKENSKPLSPLKAIENANESDKSAGEEAPINLLEQVNIVDALAIYEKENEKPYQLMDPWILEDIVAGVTDPTKWLKPSPKRKACDEHSSSAPDPKRNTQSTKGLKLKRPQQPAFWSGKSEPKHRDVTNSNFISDGILNTDTNEISLTTGNEEINVENIDSLKLSAYGALDENSLSAANTKKSPIAEPIQTIVDSDMDARRKQNLRLKRASQPLSLGGFEVNANIDIKDDSNYYGEAKIDANEIPLLTAKTEEINAETVKTTKILAFGVPEHKSYPIKKGNRSYYVMNQAIHSVNSKLAIPTVLDDWTIKDHVRISSKKPFTFDELLVYTSDFRRNRIGTPKDFELEESRYYEFRDCLKYWIYPQNELYALVERNTEELSARNYRMFPKFHAKDIEQLAQSQKSREDEWKEAFDSLYFNLINGSCSYFYYKNSEFIALFLSSNYATGEQEQLEVILNRSTERFKNQITDQGISFKIPLYQTVNDMYYQGREKITESRKVDKTFESLLLIEGYDQVTKLYKLLLDWREPHDSERFKLFPSFLSPKPMDNFARREAKTVKIGSDTIEVHGLLLPTKLTSLRTLLDDLHGHNEYDLQVHLSKMSENLEKFERRDTWVPERLSN
ncbi:hypothetical protein G9A89_022782 [Geosiphon pyriformis]|nr:hypothetical protein G9A89_022782 [Geosiphon pyriformis]